MTTQMIVSSTQQNHHEPVPEGLHAAACVGLYDVGTQYNERHQVSQRKLAMIFELPELPGIEMEKDGNKVVLPRQLATRYTKSLGEKSRLRQVLESWRGRKFTETELAGFDIAKLLGTPCQVQVLHDKNPAGRTFASVSQILPAPKNYTPQIQTSLVCFSIDDLDKPELPGEVPEWIGRIVRDSREWQRLELRAANRQQEASKEGQQEPKSDSDDDNLPF